MYFCQKCVCVCCVYVAMVIIPPGSFDNECVCDVYKCERSNVGILVSLVLATIFATTIQNRSTRSYHFLSEAGWYEYSLCQQRPPHLQMLFSDGFDAADTDFRRIQFTNYQENGPM